MSTLTYTLLFLLAIQISTAEVNVKDYIYWTKADMSAWHQYFPSRRVEQERLTIQTAMQTVTDVVDGFGTSLVAVVRYQQQELETAKFMMEGTSAQGCIQGISNYMDRAVDEGVESFRDCVADASSSLQRIYNSWVKTNISYTNAYVRALTGIDTCARIYPNRDSWSRLRSCVEAWTNNYFTTANKTTMDMYVSRAMGVFTGPVATCAETAARDVVDQGRKFLDMLVQCARLSENVDSEMYEQELTSEYDSYITSNDLVVQMWRSMTQNDRLVRGKEQQMVYYYALQKRALEKYVIESRDQNYYFGQMVQYLLKYLNTVSSTIVDNPADTKCVSEADLALNRVLMTGAHQAWECDVKIVNNTKFLIARVNEYFSQINDILPLTGNVAILSCLSEGYIFAEQTVSTCYSLAANGYQINITELNASIVEDVKVLLGYEESFFGNASLPCGDSILSHAFLEADRALYNLQRCLYISTGTKYAVTTSPPYTADSTTPIAASTTSTNTTPAPTTGTPTISTTTGTPSTISP